MIERRFYWFLERLVDVAEYAHFPPELAVSLVAVMAAFAVVLVFGIALALSPWLGLALALAAVAWVAWRVGRFVHAMLTWGRDT